MLILKQNIFTDIHHSFWVYFSINYENFLINPILKASRNGHQAVVKELLYRISKSEVKDKDIDTSLILGILYNFLFNLYIIFIFFNFKSFCKGSPCNRERIIKSKC